MAIVYLGSDLLAHTPKFSHKLPTLLLLLHFMTACDVRHRYVTKWSFWKREDKTGWLH